MLAADVEGSQGGHAAQGLTLGINDIPAGQGGEQASAGRGAERTTSAAAQRWVLHVAARVMLRAVLGEPKRAAGWWRVGCG